MSRLDSTQFQNLALQLRDEVIGAQAQEFWLSGQWLAFKLYLRGQISWLVFDLDPIRPAFALMESIQSLQRKEEKKPLLLFLRAHFRGQKIERAEHALDFGRVLIFHFLPGFEIEVRLFSHGTNVIARTPDKELTFRKPQPLTRLESPMASSVLEEGQEFRDTMLTLPRELPRRGPVAGQAKGQADESVAVAQFEKRKKKLHVAIDKVRADLTQKENSKWEAAGEWLKEHPPQDGHASWREAVPADLLLFVKGDLSWSENLNHCFRKAKELAIKIKGSQARLAELEEELAKMLKVYAEQGVNGVISSKGQPRVQKSETTTQLLSRAQAKGRTFALEDGVHFYVGKAAQDNLRLLREAKPWHLWLHLRDYPGAHGIMTRNKNQKIADSLLHEAAHNLLNCQFGEKARQKHNEKFDILVTECRFVRPIKGDRQGKVTHTHSRLLTHLFKLN